MKASRRLFFAALITVIIGPAICQADTNSAAVYLGCLTNFQQYANSIWHTASFANAPANSGYFGDGGSAGNGGIRGTCGVALAYAVMCVALPNDPATPGRLTKITQTLNYAANTHVSGSNVCNDGLQWGHDWQTAEWGGSMGFACFLVQSNLPTSTVAAVQRAVADEATYRAGVAPASGYVGDTKAEENGWDGNIVALAAAWLSTNTNASLWLTGAKKYMANTYTVANTNGDALASWVNTVTLYPDYELQNHGFYYPIYQMVAGMSLADSWLMALLSNPGVAAQLQPFAEHNVTNVWSALQLVDFDSGDFAYPASLDWTLHDYEQNSYMAWLASHFNDPAARWIDTALVKSESYRQQINGNGTFIGPSETDSPFYREAVEARRTAMAYLFHTHADFTNGPMTAPAAYAPQSFPDVRLIEQRGASGYFSISYYGSQVMGIIAPPAISIPANMYLVTPKLPGVIGLGALGTPTAASLIGFTTNGMGFDAEMQLQNGSQGTTEVYIKSTGDAVALVEVPFPAQGILGSAQGSFTVGIENQPLTGGTRLLEWSGGNLTVTNRSGVSQTMNSPWVCVAGEYGMIAGPSGYFSYQAASSYNILGAAQDTLQFMESSLVGPRYCIWFPGKNAAMTQAGASNVTWTVSGTNASLSFTAPSGNAYQISAILPPPSTNPYPSYTLSISNITASSSQGSYPPTLAMDGNLSTFWVSSGVNPGQGPTTNHPEWLLTTFPRQVAISEFVIAPRTLNGGYGPKAVQMLLNGAAIYSGTMAATSNLDVHLSPPVYATNAELLITSSYDPSYPTNSRNVQVCELTFYERAKPDTFGDWALNQFSYSQSLDVSVSGPDGDPDGDGVPNLVEFATGGNPFVADSSNALAQIVNYTSGKFVLNYRERKDLGDVQRVFEYSTNLWNWSPITPSQFSIVANLPTVYIRQATFPASASNTYFRVGFQINPNP